MSNKLVLVCGTLLLALLLLGCMNESRKEGFKQIDCINDCKKIGAEFFKYDYSAGGYGPNVTECWCVDNNIDVKQVW